MKKVYYGIGFALSCLLLSGCASSKDPEAQFHGQSATQIFQGAEVALHKHNYATAVRHYEGLDALYPFSPYSEQAMLDSIYAYYQSGDPASAAATATRFIHTYPASPHVDYAWYMKAVAEMRQDRTWTQRYLPLDLAARDPGAARQAYTDLSTLITHFPASPYVPDAKQRLIYLRNLFAQHQVEVANFYWKRKAYVAASNRASSVVVNFPQTPAVEEALAIMVKSYRALGLEAEANKTLQILQLNYPHSQYLQKKEVA